MVPAVVPEAKTQRKGVYLIPYSNRSKKRRFLPCCKGKTLKVQDLPEEEKNFRKSYVKAPSFLSIHMGVKASVLPGGTDCHRFILEDDWPNLQRLYGSMFLLIPTVLDPSLAPEGHHILHIFTPAGIEDWEGLSRKDYEQKKELVANEIIGRLEKRLFPGLQDSIVLKEVCPYSPSMLGFYSGRYEETKAKGTDNYDRELEETIERLIVECKRKIQRALKRLEEEDAKVAIAISVTEVTQSKEVIEFSKQIKEKMKEIAAFDGCHNQKADLDWRISSC